MKWQDFIEQRPEIMTGKPVFIGTRLTVESILERLGDGWSEEDLLKSFPRLTKQHIQAACAYAAAALSSELTMLMPEPAK
jgi:uncharacterized protein (DUF433 family)